MNVHKVQFNKPTPLALRNFSFNEICSGGNCGCFKLQIQTQITPRIVPCMREGRKMQNIEFYRKLHSFQMVIIVSRTSHISYKFVTTEYCKVGNVFNTFHASDR